jgi:hypothetical protein
MMIKLIYVAIEVVIGHVGAAAITTGEAHVYTCKCEPCLKQMQHYRDATR